MTQWNPILPSYSKIIALHMDLSQKCFSSQSSDYHSSGAGDLRNLVTSNKEMYEMLINILCLVCQSGVVSNMCGTRSISIHISRISSGVKLLPASQNRN